MRKILFIAAGVCAGLLAIVAAIVFFADFNQFREPIRAQLEKRLKRPVSIGKLGLKLMPLSIRLDDVAVGDSPKFAARTSFIAAQQMYVHVGLAALLHKQVDVQSLHLVRPTVELIRNAQGEWNFATLGESGGGGGGNSSVQLAHLQIDDGRVAITDLQLKRPRAVYDHIDVKLDNFSPGQRFALDAQAHLPAKGNEVVRAHVTGDTPAAGSSFSLAGLDGEVSLDGVSMSGLQAFLGAPPSEIAKAVFNGKAQFQRHAGSMNGQGSIAITDPRLKEPAKIDFQFQDQNDTGVFTLSSATLKLGGLAVNGSGAIRTKETPSTVTGRFRMDNAALAAVLDLASALGFNEGVHGTGVLSLDARVSGPVNAIAYDATGSLRDAKLSLDSLTQPVEIQTVGLKLNKDEAALDNLAAAVGSSHLRGNVAVHNFAHPDLRFDASLDRLDTAELEHLMAPSTGKKAGPHNLTGNGSISIGSLTYNQIALNDVHAACKLENGIVRLDPLSAKIFGGEQVGSIVVDTRQQETAFDVRARINRVDANKLLSAATSVKDLLFGMLSGDIDVHAAPHKGEEAARALNGTVKLQLLDGKLAGVQLLNEMAGLAKFLGYARRTETFTNILKLAGTLKIQNGVANTDDLQMSFDGGSLGGAGTIGLADQQLRMRITTVLAKGLSQAAGGSQIGGWMSTALGNSKGELVIPAIVSGTLQKPRFEPDAQRIAKMKLDGLLPTHDNPAGAVSSIQGIVGALTGKPAANGAPQKKPGILDIINGLGKK